MKIKTFIQTSFTILLQLILLAQVATSRGRNLKLQKKNIIIQIVERVTFKLNLVELRTKLRYVNGSHMLVASSTLKILLLWVSLSARSASKSQK